MNADTAYWVMVVLAAIPMPLLLMTWLGWLSPPASVSAVRLFLLIVATGSDVWLVLAMKFPMFLGESYSTSRFAIIAALPCHFPAATLNGLQDTRQDKEEMIFRRAASALLCR